MTVQAAIVTGAGSGIGRALTELLAREYRLTVLAVSRSGRALQETAAATPDLIRPLAADITSETERALIADEARSLPRPVALFHGAGSFTIGRLESLGEDDWRRSFETNVTARLLLTRELLPELHGGRVLFIGSDAAVTPRVGAAAYSIAQAASEMLAKSLRIELKAHDVSVGLFKPGLVATPMVERFLKKPPENFPDVAAYRKWIDTGAIAKPEKIASFAAWLLMKTTDEEFAENPWDVRDKNHHAQWLEGKLYSE